MLLADQPLRNAVNRLELGLHQLSVADLDVGVLVAVEHQHRRLHLRKLHVGGRRRRVRAEELTGVRYGSGDNSDVSLRILADHGRSVSFMLADGVLPSNEERGYVLRLIMRRAIRHARLLGHESEVLGGLIERNIDLMNDAYPELGAKRDLALEVAEREEARFDETLKQGLSLLETEIERGRSEGQRYFGDGRLYVERYVENPWRGYLHIAPGVIYLLGAPLQLSRRFRTRHYDVHRRLVTEGREIRAAFTEGSDRYSGFLPTLETSDRDILRLYHTGILGVIYFKRELATSAYGRAYTTLMPRYWQPVTFIWDYFLSSQVHALLDPACMKKYLELWMHTDIHKHFGTEYLTGAGVGPCGHPTG